MEYVYAVERIGIYKQGTTGVFDNPEDAKACAVRSIENERDDYHDFLVVRYPFGCDIARGESCVVHIVERTGVSVSVTEEES